MVWRQSGKACILIIKMFWWIQVQFLFPVFLCTVFDTVQDRCSVQGTYWEHLCVKYTESRGRNIKAKQC